MNPVAERIAGAVMAMGRLSRTDVYRLFSMHIAAEAVDQAVTELVVAGRITVERELTKGRPRVMLAHRRDVPIGTGAATAMRPYVVEEGGKHLHVEGSIPHGVDWSDLVARRGLSRDECGNAECRALTSDRVPTLDNVGRAPWWTTW